MFAKFEIRYMSMTLAQVLIIWRMTRPSVKKIVTKVSQQEIDLLVNEANLSWASGIAIYSNSNLGFFWS